MKSKRRWSWLFGGEPTKPRKKRRPNGHRINGRADSRFPDGLHALRGVASRAERRNRSAAQRSSFRMQLEGAHDFYLTNDSSGGSMVLRACLMRGFSDVLSLGPNAPESNRQSVATEKTSIKKWLVLEHPDGRLSYVLSDRVWYIEETSSAASNSSVEKDRHKTGNHF